MLKRKPIPDRDTIYAHLRDTLVAMFEISADDIHDDARLYEDLDIDSLDAVDLIVKLRDLTGIQVKPEQFQNVRTVADVVDAIQGLTGKAGIAQQ
ncbi:MAG: acyl carrier protein [Salinisphaera sp.]|nr:acyl carrier protein [Nevskiaceae bacterium]MDN5937567.1 acyl carrier protein [Salinisphaera sp.]